MSPKKKNKRISIKQKRRRKILKWTSLIILAITAITLFLLSSVFNIKKIDVVGNTKVTSEEIISSSEIKTGENMFKFLKLKARDNIKKNPYIEEVKIKRKLNGTIEINISERVATYMLALEESQFAYINNQGYVLEISTDTIEKPIILGYKTENIEEGIRLNLEDLKKLNHVIKIMKAAEEKGILEKVTSINIENNQDIILTMDDEGKVIHFGDEKNINDKFVKLIAVLEDTIRTKRRNILKKY